jgi:hypothetical protein
VLRVDCASLTSVLRSLFIHALCFGGLVLTIRPAAAGPILSTSNSAYSVASLNDPLQFLRPPVTVYCQSTGACSGTATVINGVTQLNYATSSTSDYGVLKASASGSLVRIDPCCTAGVANISDVDAVGAASFRDQWNIAGGQAGDPGTLGLTFMITGIFSSNDKVAEGFLSAANFNGGSVGTFITQSGTFQLSLPFTVGQTLDFQVTLRAIADLSVFNLGNNGASATTDLSHTVQLTSVRVLDNGTAIPFTFTTASGSPNFANLETPRRECSWPVLPDCFLRPGEIEAVSGRPSFSVADLFPLCAL